MLISMSVFTWPNEECFFLFFWFWRRVDVLVDADVSEKHTVSIFQGWSDKAGK
jgi:hypothetical protein